MLGLKPLPYQRYKLTIQYDGSQYAGWQQQKMTSVNCKRSVQRVLEDVINERLVFRRTRTKHDDDDDNCDGDSDDVGSDNFVSEFEQHKYVKCYGSSRTDSGVHAVAQTCHIDLCKVEKRTGAPILRATCGGGGGNSGEWEQYEPLVLLKALNHSLQREDIRIVHVERVHKGYHARHVAKSRSYLYRIHVNCPSELSLEKGRVWFLNRSTWLFFNETGTAPVELDLDAMRLACKAFLGRHDFSCFASKPNKRRVPVSPVRTLDRFELEVRQYGEVDTIPPIEVFPGYKPYEIRFHLSARSFLHHQVRLMVHAVVLVGLGRLTVESIRNMLQHEKRRNDVTSRMAPPDGLYLMQVLEDDKIRSQEDRDQQ